MWLDPQQRKMLEVSYECFESAGLTFDEISGKNIAVFVGCFTSDYQQMSISEPDFRHNYCATGVDVGIMSNRIGNAFNLNGPSFTINTACSSSVYAIHHACHALRARDCEAALAGGVNLILTVDQHINTAKLGVLSGSSTCHTFDAAADGYGRAEGVGALYLKRLSDAIRDGDVIRGVIRSSAVNTNGKVDGMGITFPSVAGQERAIRSAYKRANLDPTKTAYCGFSLATIDTQRYDGRLLILSVVECHGTGTPVGDPVEVRAVANAMNDNRSADEPLLLGAVKANIGHSEAASGIFAVMKAAMVTESGMLPGVCGFQTLNPNIKEQEWNVKVNTDLVPWPEGFPVRRASVSSFGYGGTNGHVIVESIDTACPWYEHAKPKAIATYEYDVKRPFLIGMSAHDKKTLVCNITAHQKVSEEYHLPDLAYTLNSRRTRFLHRGYTIAFEGSETAAFDASAFTLGTASSKPGKVGFAFTGQGAQWPRMGYEALQAYPIFGTTIDALDRVLQSGAIDPKPTWTLRSVLESKEELSRIGEADVSQPACTAVQVAIVDLFASWGMEASVSVGHSSGEIGAAYASGRLSAPEAILAAFLRGFAIKKSAPAGAMLAVGVGPLEAERSIPESMCKEVTIACENSPSSTTLSGTCGGIAATKKKFDEAGIFARELRTGKAYHSCQMDAVAPLYELLFLQAVEKLSKDDFNWRRSKTDMISSVTGTEYSDDNVSISYLCSNLRNRVLFDSAMNTLGNSESFADGGILIEIGPHSALKGPIKQICSVKGFNDLDYAPSLVRGTDSAVALLKTAGALFNKGSIELDFKAINMLENSTSVQPIKQRGIPRFIPDLPTYQWNHEHNFWYEPRTVQERRQSKHERHDLLGRRVFGLSENAAAWKNNLRQRDVPWLKDHTLGGSVIFPAAGYLSLAIEAYLQLLDIDHHRLAGVKIQDVNIGSALVIPENDSGIEIHTRLQTISGWEGDKVRCSFAVESFDDGRWTTHTEGKIRGILIEDDIRSSKTPFKAPVASNELRQRTQAKRWYDSFHRAGFEYGPSFQTLHAVQANGRDCVTAAAVQVQTSCGLMRQESRYMLHPSTIDGCLHLVIASIHRGLHKDMPWAVVPLEIEETNLFFPGNDDAAEGPAVAWTDKCWNDRYFNHGTQLLGASGRLLMEMKNIKTVIYDAAISHRALDLPIREAYARVSWKPYLAEASDTDTSDPHSDEVLISDQMIAMVSGQPQSSNVSALRNEMGLASTPYSLSIDDIDLPSRIGVVDNFVVDDRAGTLLSQICKMSFENIKAILCSGKSIVWLTRGVNQGKTVSGGMAQGFLRAVRSELVASRITLLDADEAVSTTLLASEVRERLANNATKDSGRDVEFWLQADSSLQVPRIVANEALNGLFFNETECITTAIAYGTPLNGKIQGNEVIFETGSETKGGLSPYEAEIQVHFSELAEEDLKPRCERPHIVAGTIVRVGAKLDPSWLGQTVISYSTQPFPTMIKAKAFVNIPIPDEAAIFAASLPKLCEAVDAVLKTGNAKSGDHVLVLPSTDESFNKMVINLGQEFGFKVTCSSEDLACIQEILASSEAPNVVVASSSSALTQEVWRLMPSGGRFILSNVSIDWPLDLRPFTRGASFHTRGISALVENDQAALQNVLQTSAGLVSGKSELFAEAAQIVDVERLQDVTSLTADVSGSRYNVLQLKYDESKVKVGSSPSGNDWDTDMSVKSKKVREQINFSDTSAYLLVGCLGGLGRSLTLWMLERGCRNFVFLSRSGTDKAEAAEVVAQLLRCGASVQVFRVDAGDEKAVADVVLSVQADTPIRGVVHAAMVLQVRFIPSGF